jgi:NADH dehydrogenase (ubiquinone) 1 alpha subcomplex subunit 6
VRGRHSTQLYAINFPASAIRAKVRQEFERNQMVDDLQTVDVLLLKGQQEFQEVSNGEGIAG